jgi:hypothetical protein
VSRAVEVALGEVRAQAAEAEAAGWPVAVAVERARVNLDDMEAGSAAWMVIGAAADDADRAAAFGAADRLMSELLESARLGATRRVAVQ